MFWEIATKQPASGFNLKAGCFFLALAAPGRVRGTGRRNNQLRVRLCDDGWLSGSALWLFDLPANLTAGESRGVYVDVIVAGVGRDVCEQRLACGHAGLDGPIRPCADRQWDDDGPRRISCSHVDVPGDSRLGEIAYLERVAKFRARHVVTQKTTRPRVDHSGFLLVVEGNCGHTTRFGVRNSTARKSERGNGHGNRE